jgi:hypothetical protein
MDTPVDRKLRFFLRLYYPLEIVWDSEQISGKYPDLPGCEQTITEVNQLEELKAELEMIRLCWLSEKVEAGETPPLPNSYLND